MLRSWLIVVLASQATALQLGSASTRQTRRAALGTATAAFVLPLPHACAADATAAAATQALLREARAQLEPCAQAIADGNWDGVRTVVKTAPLANSKNLITRYIEEAGDAADDLVVPREDLVQAMQLLDMAVYNNNFISEQNAQGARGKGVSVDRDTPTRHLKEAKDALDEVLALKI